MDLIAIDAGRSAGGGQLLRGALSLAAVTGRGFRLDRIRAARQRPGLRPEDLACVRAAALACGAEVHGAFDGSPDLRFVPGSPVAGEFAFEIGGAGAGTLVVQTLAPILALAPAASRLSVQGRTHLARSPSHEFLERHWVPAVDGLGLRLRPRLACAGFGPGPRGEGRIECEVEPWQRPGRLEFWNRGRLVAVRGCASWARLRTGVAQRAADAARELLWEERRLESQWQVQELPAAAPGWSLQIEAVFEEGRAAFAQIGERGQRPEVHGARAVRWLLRFLDQDEAAVDPWLADQLVVPLAAARGGGRLRTSEVSSHLETAAAIAGLFGIPARTFGRRGGPGGVEVGAW